MSLKIPFISLRIRFMAVAVFLTLGSSAIWGGWTWKLEKNSLFERHSREGEQLVSTMAIPIINALLYEELGIIREGGLLDNFVGEIMANPRLHTRYAMVLDVEGRVLAHNRYSEYGTVYDDSLSTAALNAGGFIQTDVVIGGERVSDLAIPLAIAGKRWGCLRVGSSLEPAYSDLRKLERQIVFFSILFSCGALLIYWFIGTWLARPIVSLTRNMENVGKRQPVKPLSRIRRDEIGQLQKSFAEMLDRLNRSEAERQSSITRMLENERIAAVGRIVSGVAHEVNNPLAGIEAVLYQLEQKSGAESHRYIGLIRQSIERIGRIVSQLSDLSRASDIDPVPVECKDFFEDLALFAKMALKTRDCRIATHNDCRGSTIRVDRDKINQVVLNLVLNAADATPPGGTVQLRAYLESDHYILDVRDSGPGVAAGLREEIFTPFFTTKEPGKGSGMGLAISRGIIEKHHGTLSCCPSSSGALFRISIPQQKRSGEMHA